MIIYLHVYIPPSCHVVNGQLRFIIVISEGGWIILPLLINIPDSMSWKVAKKVASQQQFAT